MEKIICTECENAVHVAQNYVECAKLHRFIDWYWWRSLSPEYCPLKEIKDKKRGENMIEKYTIEELKSCPFCGGKALLRKIEDYIKPYYILCGNMECEMLISTRNFRTAKEAVEAWNRRAE